MCGPPSTPPVVGTRSAAERCTRQRSGRFLLDDMGVHVERRCCVAMSETPPRIRWFCSSPRHALAAAGNGTRPSEEGPRTSIAWQPVRDSNPCRHLERASGTVRLVLWWVAGHNLHAVAAQSDGERHNGSASARVQRAVISGVVRYSRTPPSSTYPETCGVHAGLSAAELG